MIKANFNTYASYVTDSLYQWDLNQVLSVSGLNLSVVPEVHFSNANMDKAIVRQATKVNNVVSVAIPNSLLQDPLTIRAHIGIYEGDTFKVVELVEIPIVARKRPSDYRIEDADEEIYSFKALENALVNMVKLSEFNANNATIAARIDNIIAHNNDTEGNTELVDIRLDVNGTMHLSAGEAVRSQIGALNKLTRAENLIDFKKLTRGYLTSDGWINNYDNDYRVTNEVTTDFIPIDASKKYYFAHNFNRISEIISNGQSYITWTGFALYDENKTFIKRAEHNESSFIVSGADFEGAAYVRISYRTYMFNYPIFAVSDIPCTSIDEIITEDNLLKTYPMIFNGYVGSQNGAIIGTTHDMSGYIPTETNELTSDFIPCEGGKEMFIFATASRDNYIRIGFYGSNGYFISSIAYCATSADTIRVDDYENILTTFIIPDNAVSMRISCRGAYIEECVLAYNNDKNKYLYKDCERKHNSKYESEKLETLYSNNETDFNFSNVKSINHRGYCIEAPENTLSAYKLSKKKGFNYVECDVAFTSDGIAVLLHDNTIDRTSNGTGNINELTFDEVRALDFGSWFSSDYTGEKIPKFDEFILLCRNLGLHPYIEIKSSATYTQPQIETLVNIVKRAGMSDKVSWISFNSTYLEYVKNVNSKARLGYVVDAVTETVISKAVELKTEDNDVFIDSNHGTVTDDLVTLCIDADIPLEVWTVNNETSITSLNCYISGVTSDNLIASRTLIDANLN